MITDHKVSPLIARVIINLDIDQAVQVMWSGMYCIFFVGLHGTKQSGVASMVLFRLYI